MKKNNKNGFTLVELLAVIAVLGLILIIAIPKVMETLNTQKKRTLELTTRSIIKSAEEKYLENTSYGINEEITCESVSNITNNDFESCTISFDENGNASVTINGKGRYEDLSCQGTKEGITCQKGAGARGLHCTYNGKLEQGVKFVHNQYTYSYKQQYMAGWENMDQDGWGVILTDKTSTDPVNTPVCSYINGKPLVSTSMMFVEIDSYENPIMSQTSEIDVSSWDTSNVTNMMGMFAYAMGVSEIKGLSKLETGNVTDMSMMFAFSILGTTNHDKFDLNATRILDLSNFDTSNVTNMMGMFAMCGANSLDLSSFNTSKVTAMESMFQETLATTLNISSFDTSNVTDMSYMFSEIKVETLDLSSFDTSNVTYMGAMFENSEVTTGYARTQVDADKFNNVEETSIPETLTFTVKTN